MGMICKEWSAEAFKVIPLEDVSAEGRNQPSDN